MPVRIKTPPCGGPCRPDGCFDRNCPVGMTDEDEPTTDARPVPLDEDDGPREGPEYAFDPKAGW